MSNIKKRGFASMDPQLVREIASKGGRRAHELGRGHEFTSETAREAGRKGGTAKRDMNRVKLGLPLDPKLRDKS